MVGIGADVDRLQVIEQGRALVPGHVLRPADHVVAQQGGNRHEGDLRDIEARGEVLVVGDDLVEALLRPVDQVHLVHGHYHVLDLQQGGDEGMAAGLLDDAVARVHEDDGQVGRGGPGDHVAGVLDVARGVGDDELALRGREVAVGDVNRDPLFALGPQAVGEQGQVDVLVAALLGAALDRFQLVLEDGLGVVHQPADEGRLAVID